MTPLTQAKILKVQQRETLPERRLQHDLSHLTITLSVKNFLALMACAGTSEIADDLKDIKVVIPQPITASLEALVMPTTQKKSHTTHVAEPPRTPPVTSSSSHVALDDGDVIDLTGVNPSSSGSSPRLITPTLAEPPQTPVAMSSSCITLDNGNSVIDLTGIDPSSSDSSLRPITYKHWHVESILEVVDLTGED